MPTDDESSSGAIIIELPSIRERPLLSHEKERPARAGCYVHTFRLDDDKRTVHCRQCGAVFEAFDAPNVLPHRRDAQPPSLADEDLGELRDIDRRATAAHAAELGEGVRPRWHEPAASAARRARPRHRNVSRHQGARSSRFQRTSMGYSFFKYATVSCTCVSVR